RGLAAGAVIAHAVMTAVIAEEKSAVAVSFSADMSTPFDSGFLSVIAGYWGFASEPWRFRASLRLAASWVIAIPRWVGSSFGWLRRSQGLFGQARALFAR